MSAYIVEKFHIDYLVTAALNVSQRDGGRFTWLHKFEPEPEGTHERGQVWGPEAIAYANRSRQELNLDNADEIGDMLWTENYRSVNHRYNKEDSAERYTFKQHLADFDAVQVLQSIRCYEYQSCEHPEWESSNAKAFCETLEKAIIRHLPGMDNAEWGAPEHVAGRVLLSGIARKARK